jgi:cytosine/adenosine deaminase-related metal-dependent hydrolase
MSQVLFTNVNVFDATGEMPYPGEVLVEGNKIVRVTKTHQGMRNMPLAGQTVIDGAGCFLMPGMVEAHTHFRGTTNPAWMRFNACHPKNIFCGALKLPRFIWTWAGPHA